MNLSKDMLGKSVSLDEDDGSVATTSSQLTEESTSVVQGNSETSTGAPSPEEILPDQVFGDETDTDEETVPRGKVVMEKFSAFFKKFAKIF